MLRGIKKVDSFVNTILEFIVITMLSIMSVVVFAQVVFRLVHASIPWSEELSKYLLIWSTFLGSALCVRKGSMVGLEFIGDALPEKGRIILKTVVNLAVAALLILLISVGFWASRRVWFQTTPVLKLPMGLMYASIPTGAMFMLLNTLLTIYYSWEEEE